MLVEIVQHVQLYRELGLWTLTDRNNKYEYSNIPSKYADLNEKHMTD